MEESKISAAKAKEVDKEVDPIKGYDYIDDLSDETLQALESELMAGLVHKKMDRKEVKDHARIRDLVNKYESELVDKMENFVDCGGNANSNSFQASYEAMTFHSLLLHSFMDNNMELEEDPFDGLDGLSDDDDDDDEGGYIPSSPSKNALSSLEQEMSLVGDKYQFYLYHCVAQKYKAAKKEEADKEKAQAKANKKPKAKQAAKKKSTPKSATTDKKKKPAQKRKRSELSGDDEEYHPNDKPKATRKKGKASA